MNPEPIKPTRRWSWWQFSIALSMIVLGSLGWFGGLVVALGAGSSGVRSDDWMVPIAEVYFIMGPLFALVGAIWLLTRIILLFIPPPKPSDPDLNS